MNQGQQHSMSDPHRDPHSPLETTNNEAPVTRRHDDAQLAALASRIKGWGRELGFGAVGISDIDLSHAEAGLAAWLDAGCHGEMDYMAKHGMKRARPAELVAGTRRVISVRMAYLPASSGARKGDESAVADVQHDWRLDERARLEDPTAAVVSFTDSAPVLEVELAQKAGTGWRGKHTLLLQRDAGSLFFLGEIFVDVPLPTDAETSPESAPETPGAHCGSCTRCIGACPTGAIVAPYQVDARRCISYLTIELKGSIPQDLRPLIGNRVYGCDDCQLVCPWNKFAQAAPVADFDVRHGLDRASLVELFGWTASDFDTRMQGSAIRRIGYECWLRNLAVGMGNALRAARDALSADARAAIVDALRQRADDPSPLVREHVEWALEAA